MPVLDTLTFKNPLLMWLQRNHYVAGFPNPLVPIVTKFFSERKQAWKTAEEKGIQISDHDTLVDKFLIAERDNTEKIDIKPQGHALTMIIAGSETT